MYELKVTVYTPESSLRNPARMLREMFGDLLAGRDLAWQVALRDTLSWPYQMKNNL